LKLNKNYILRSVAGSDVVVAVGEEANKLRGMITLNETAAFIWRCLEEGLNNDDTVERLKQEFTGADDERLRVELSSFIDKLQKLGIVQEE
jgi:DNA-binding transcriptional regulator YhcF (GntR family)